jgi:predicted ArsR family transcriptional regulator
MQPRPPATRAEARALAHPLRLRIIRLTRDRALTISELGGLLGIGKATVLHHVRTLLQEGFLVPAAPRRSAAGRPEKPYRSTGKSLTITLTDVPDLPLAVLDAFRQEVAGLGDPSPAVVRRSLRLDEASYAELVRQLRAVVEEFEARPDPAGWPVNLLAIAVRYAPD